MTDIHPGLAQQVVMQTEETFQQFQERIYQTRYPIRCRDEYDNAGNLVALGKPIEVEPDAFYSFLRLQLSRPATPEEFGALFMLIMTAVAQAEAQGVIPSNWVKEVATPFDLITSSIPAHFVEALPEDMEIKTYLEGEMRYRVEVSQKSEENEPEEPEP